MATKISSYILGLMVFTAILFGVHYYLLTLLFQGSLYFPIWTIYVFNTILVLIVYSVIVYKSEKGSKTIYQLFLGLTTLKMVLAVVFLSPLFMGKSSHTQLEIINFFIPYFLFLGFEIFSLNKFLKKS